VNAALWNLTVPVDASAASRRGVDYAIELGRKGATLHFCSVVDATQACLGGAVGAPIDPEPIVQAMNEDARRACDDALAAARGSGLTSHATVIFGAVVPEIGRFVREQASDAIVIGTHARRGAVRALLGSVAESLMQTIAVPVVVTHADDVPEDGPIVVAVDGTPAAMAALDVAIDLARARQRSLSIVHAVNGGPETERVDRPVLSAAGGIARSAGIAFERATLEGSAADAIIAYAQRQHSPMIVIGTSGRSDLARLLLGSEAAAVVERAHVPVTVVRQPVSSS
jgi:nucleotide-binding universal stress UspA family protein